VRFVAFATDYDETLAGHGVVLPGTLLALQRLKAGGRKLLLVTGRDLDDLKLVFPEYAMFDAIVAENGGVLFRPADDSVRALGEPPPASFVEALRRHRVQPLTVGRVIVATRVPYETVVVEEIRRLGLELQVIFNKGAVMVLPGGVNKGTGVRTALAELALSPHNCVAVGDAENDHVFLSEVGLGAAVANALPGLKDRADIVLRGVAEEGVVDLIEAILRDDLRSLAARIPRHEIEAGVDERGRPVRVGPSAGPLLLEGAAAPAFVARAIERRYQCCIVDPQGEYVRVQRAVQLGTEQRAPDVDEVVRALANPGEQIVVDLRAAPAAGRQSFVSSLLPRLRELRDRAGRPHWIVLAQAQQLVARELSEREGVALTGDAAKVDPALRDQLRIIRARAPGG
jgi:hydroxymethylpyrimidine pyrophosphatase-like HAD family hydrolase